jgi:hypothetical protein
MEAASHTEATPIEHPWFTDGVRGIGAASLLADLGHEIPTALLPSLLTTTLGAPASALGLIEGVSDGLAGPHNPSKPPHGRRAAAVGATPPRRCFPG